MDDMDKKVLEALDQHSFLARLHYNPAQTAQYLGMKDMATLIYAERGLEIAYDEETEKHRFIKAE